MVHRTTTDNRGYLRTARRSGSPARTPLTSTRPGTIPSMACKGSGVQIPSAPPRAPAFSRYGAYVRIVAGDPAVPTSAEAVSTAARLRGLNRTNHDESRERRGPALRPDGHSHPKTNLRLRRHSHISR